MSTFSLIDGYLKLCLHFNNNFVDSLIVYVLSLLTGFFLQIYILKLYKHLSTYYKFIYFN